MSNSIAISHLSLEYVSVPVTVTTLAGAAYNPTGDPVVMAFMPQPTQVPQLTDWVTAIWSANPSNVLYPYAANCLVGPGGTITLGIGQYIIYVKITDNPEVPVERAPLLLEVYLWNAPSVMRQTLSSTAGSTSARLADIFQVAVTRRGKHGA